MARGGEGPLLPRRRLGAELRQLRGHRTLEQVAEDTLISTSKLSRLENGQGIPQPRDIRDLINYYQVESQAAKRLRDWTSAGRKQAWWKEYSDVVPQPLESYLDFESGASTIRTFALSVIPGLLQIHDYSVLMLRAISLGATTEQVDQLVEIRKRRQEKFFDTENPARLITIIDEAALRRIVGSEQLTWQQLNHLRQLAETRKINVQILPLDAGPHAGLMGVFTIFQFADDIDRDIVSIESHSGDRYMEEESSVLNYLRRFDSVSEKALNTARSVDLVSKIMSNLTPPKDEG